MNTDTKIIAGAILGSILLIGGAVFAFSKEKPAPKREELGTASISIDKTTADLGSMKVSDEKTATFTLTNTSDAILRLWNVKTSCNCTFARVKIGSEETGEFSMHAGGPLANWIGEIPASQSATLSVIYRPSIMPVQGPVSRQVTFSTNDPNNQDVSLSITANVQ